MEVLQSLGIKPVQVAIQIVGFLVLFYFLAKFLWKPILALMAAREKEVADMLARGEEAKRKSEQMEADYKTRLAQIDEEAAKYRNEELRKGHAMAEEIVQEARHQAELEKEKSLNAIREETKKARVELRDFAVGLSLDISQKILQAKIGREEHEQLARKFLAELDSMN